MNRSMLQSAILNDIVFMDTVRLHVHGPTLAYKRVPDNLRADKRVADLPVMALRFSNDHYTNLILCHQIDCLGNPSFVDISDDPIPGSKGVVAVFQTKDRVRVYWPADRGFPRPVPTPDGRDPADILREILEKYL